LWPTVLQDAILVDIEFDKASQRLKYRQMRDDFVTHLPDRVKALAFSRIPSVFRNHLKPGMTVAGYVAKDSEASPVALLLEANQLGCDIALPHVTGRAAPMRFLRWTPGDTLVEGAFGLMQPDQDTEPCTPDVAIVPLIAFDGRLMRLGQGAGHYDRALSILADTYTVGLAWSVQSAPSLIIDPWDIPLDAILTENAWITL
jgi:5-formyltetrahydrofolate cyclo-ligase